MDADWCIDEREHAGQEHLDADEAAQFDEKLPFDPTSDIELLLDYGLSSADTIIDFGSGTGEFPIAVSPHCAKVIAVDVSESMLTVLAEKLDRQKIENVEIVHDGFLSYEHQDDPVAFAYSKDALHHLPDFWKIEALKQIGHTLQDGGILRLRDFVFSFDTQESRATIDRWIAEQQETTLFSDEEIYMHFRDEYSTYGFLLESMLESVGFDILESTYVDEFYGMYVCEW